MMHRLTDMTLDRYVKQGAFGKFFHIRQWIPIDGTWKFPKASPRIVSNQAQQKHRADSFQ